MGDETGRSTSTPPGDGEQPVSTSEDPVADGHAIEDDLDAPRGSAAEAPVLPRFEVVDGDGEGARASFPAPRPENAMPARVDGDDADVRSDSLTVPRFESSDGRSESAPSGATDRTLPTFETAESNPATPASRAAIPSRVLPRFEREVDSAAVGTLLGEAAKGTLRPEPSESVDPTPPREPSEYEPSWGGIEGPEYDEEMPLTEHIEEMIKRLAVVIVVAGSVSLVTFPFADQLINFLWYSILPSGELTVPRVYGPLELLLTRIKVASLVGLIVALPIVVYETYAFMRPGLYPHERRYYLAAIPTSLVLAVVGVTFAYFIVLPAIFTYFLFYSEDAGNIAFALGQTFDLILILMAYLAVVFQIPLFIMLAIMMGLVTRRWLAEKRLYFWGAFLGIAFLSSPDPTGMAPIIIALTMVGLFEGTLALLKWVDRGRRARRGG